MMIVNLTPFFYCRPQSPRGSNIEGVKLKMLSVAIALFLLIPRHETRILFGQAQALEMEQNETGQSRRPRRRHGIDDHRDRNSDNNNQDGYFRTHQSDRDMMMAAGTTTMSDKFYVGTGIYDITGPAAQINLMGYGKSTQTAHGIHQRLRARAFIVSQLLENVLDDDDDDDDDDDLQDDSASSIDSMAIPGTATTESSVMSVSRRRNRRRPDEYLESNKNYSSRSSLRRTSSSLFGFIGREKLDNEHYNGNRPKEGIRRASRSSSAMKNHLDPDKTICFVSIDAGMGSDLLTTFVLKRLEELLPEQHRQRVDLSDDGRKIERRLCHLENLSISGTHTHSAPGGYLQYTLYQITSMGFSKETMETYVEGVAQALLRAYNSLDVGTIRLSKDTFLGPQHVANINRSPTSYLLNPQDERELYADEGDTDKTMVQLEFSAVGREGRQKNNQNDQSTTNRSSNQLSESENQQTLIGILNWYAVHGTSMNSTNKLISGDNKGYASYLMEKHFNGQDTFPGRGDFVAAFASTNLGDASPNTAGPRCIDTGEPCDTASSTCNGMNAMCIASGPGSTMEESTEIIGRRQFDMAMHLLQDTLEENVNQGDYLTSNVAFRHSFVDMSNRNVTLENGDVVRTCPAALGYGFAAGTTDGPGEFDFRQGQNTSNPFWNLIGGFLSPPSGEQKLCQHPKPILLNTGKVSLPYSWDPETVPISIFRIGRLLILNVPCEMTTMAGRRLRKAVETIAMKYGISQPEVIIAGLSNSYTHYVTTFEEYAGQRYEAASTLYGPHTLSAYIQEFERITVDLLTGRPSISDDAPKDLSMKQMSLIPPVVLDTIGFGRSFGSTAIDSKDSYVRGKDTVFVSFRSANPRNNQRIEGTFLTVDHLLDDGSWKTLYVDGDWCTKYVWKSDVDILGVSFAEIYWTIPLNAQQGIYRICHDGTRRTLFGDLHWIAYHTPDWWAFDMFGSMAAGILAQLVRLFARLSDSFADALSSWEVGHLKDFHGCSRSFLVTVS